MSFSVTRSIDPFPYLMFLLLGLALATSVLVHNSRPHDLTESSYEYGDLGAIRNKDVCISTSTQLPYWEVKVEIVDELDDAVGRWNPLYKSIQLRDRGGTDIDTVAHEVYHMVEDVMDWYDITDPHVGAYLQGNWTKCVLGVVQHQGQFRFAD